MTQLALYRPPVTASYKGLLSLDIGALTPFMDRAITPSRPRYGRRNRSNLSSTVATKFELVKADTFDFAIGQVTGATPMIGSNAVVETDQVPAALEPLPAQEAPPSVVEEIARQRITLLALKFAQSEQAKEVLARLEILNQRLLETSPRVTMQHVAVLEESEKLVAESDARRLRLRQLISATQPR